MTKQFSRTESQITKLFKPTSSFQYQAQKYTVLKSGKPAIAKGECKTDTYVLAKSQNGQKKEFKISIKQSNADFLENKIKLERAMEILGNNASHIITASIAAIKHEFQNDYLVYFKKNGRTEANTMKIGWKFELLNKKSGKKSGELKLSPSQILDVYAGTNLDISKKNAMINSDIIANSGVANYILETQPYAGQSLQSIIDKMIPLDSYCQDKKVYFACKAINYRATKDKWDGNRPLVVYVEWTYQSGKIKSKLVFDKPLIKKANEIGNNIRNIVRSNGFTFNFEKIELLLDKNITNYYK